MSRERVKFYSSYDLSCGQNLMKAQEVVDNFTFLRILVLIIIRINEEFCLAQDKGILN